LEPEPDLISALDSAFDVGGSSVPSTPAKEDLFSADSFAESATAEGETHVSDDEPTPRLNQ